MNDSNSILKAGYAPVCRVLLQWCLFVCLLYTNITAAQTREPRSFSALKTRMIWDGAKHNAFTDLIRYRNKFYCTFRESARHVPGSKEENGNIRVLVSQDGENWTSFAVLSKEGFDLRDPNFSVTAEGRLMILMGGSVYEEGRLLKMQNHVSFLDQQVKVFSSPEPIIMDPQIQSDHNWLWHLAWQGTAGYGVIYQKVGDADGRKLYLVKTEDGRNYSLVTQLDQDELSNETAVHFLADGTMMLAVRRDAVRKNSLKPTGTIGYSKPPYKSWQWEDAGIRLGGPELVTLPGRQLLLGTRAFQDNKPYTSIFYQEPSGAFRQLFTLISGGDNSYPGMWVSRNKLWVSYYSSHEGKARIYLSVIPLKEIKKAIKGH